MANVRPPALTVTKTCTYPSGDDEIPIDVYLPETLDGPCSIMLYIHGGGWSGSNRTDYCRPLFQGFLSRQVIVTSMDYLLLPETSIDGQVANVLDVEDWLRRKLQCEFTDPALIVNGDQISVVGASSGGHLALLTAKWTKQPSSITAYYAPTNLHDVPFLGSPRVKQLLQPKLELLYKDAVDSGAFPTEKPIPDTGTTTARIRMVLTVLYKSAIVQYMKNGVIDKNGKVELPPKDSVSLAEIDAISPLHLFRRLKSIPPICLIGGERDDIFDNSHVHDLYNDLTQRGLVCKKHIVSNMGHASDVYQEIGDGYDRSVIGPCIEWAISWQDTKQTTGPLVNSV